MGLPTLFDSSVLNYNIGELMKLIDDLLTEFAPEGKTINDFTGGYIQQLKNSTRFVAFFGTKIGTNNKATSIIDVENDDVDLMYLSLKAKIQDMRAKKTNKNKVSLSKRLIKEERKPPFGKGK